MKPGMYLASNALFLNRYLLVHVHIPLRTPLLACHIAQAGSHQHQGSVTIRKTAHYSGSTANFTVQTLKRIVCPDVPRVGHGKIILRKSFVTAGFHYSGCRIKTLRP